MEAASFQKEVIRLREQVKGSPTGMTDMMEEISESYSNYKEHEKEEEFTKFIKLYNMGATNMMFTLTWALLIFGTDRVPEVFQRSFPFDTREQFYKSRFAGRSNSDPEFIAHMKNIFIGDKHGHA